jgi:hypothetical protein
MVHNPTGYFAISVHNLKSISVYAGLFKDRCRQLFTKLILTQEFKFFIRLVLDGAQQIFVVLGKVRS